MVVQTSKGDDKQSTSIRERKKQMTREAILQAAWELFLEKGFEGINMNDVEKKAVVSRSTLYNYFPTKETLYFAAGLRDQAMKREELNKKKPEAQTGLEEVLLLCRNMIQVMVDFPIHNDISRRFLQNKNLMMGTVNVANINPKKGAGKEKPDTLITAERIVGDYLKEIISFQNTWEKAIERGIQDGSINSEFTAHQLTTLVWVLIGGIADQITLRKPMLERAELPQETIYEEINRVLKILLGG
jgi:AcrR family transcriptional regulator